MLSPSPRRLSGNPSFTPSESTPVAPHDGDLDETPVAPLGCDLPLAPATPRVPAPVTHIHAGRYEFEEAPPINPTSPSPSKPRIRVPISALLDSQDSILPETLSEDATDKRSGVDIDSMLKPSFPRPIKPVPNSPPLGDLRVLLFGDEYTWGFSPDDLDHGDFSEDMKKHQHYPKVIKKAFDQYNIRASLMVSSSVKEQVGSFAARLQSSLNATWYDWVVIWGGSHDLLSGANATDIYKGLEEAYIVAWNSGSNVLLLTLLESSDFTEDMEGEREVLNELISNTNMRAHGMRTIHGLKIHQRLPNHSRSIAQRAGSSEAYADEYEARWAEKGIYPSPEGYEIVGNLVAKEIWQCWGIYPVHDERKARIETLFLD
ncbi:hypothetical protein CcaverHIS002_0608580 [Cutaneotrichosporon cavernicola]|uniref:SGNH hydrolase-type esterase domain-containing protein n=1 Tax=Cutaneotrichosporon cavernicola TaxID=279322 RepID=A0AA48L9D8_9TREE|nr:uncharacterized protein CcaverHIS019_0608030 [Cutaneotrichosporon cavernicola]BEI86571.1 hypothetical protein CcaverHIS002_0608580 [Cutaneotrichosporon cavernicola]BEI94344.1 hypothetical protein CcaverHIS019_0608030 [Cutaneotrichosporon cavernicola]BEJ02121.1 hypothetical protein CcaverHIS631_0608030 [Cutaneotrichosporon cavernicola]BEJ09882.1 hypothetical protein CcaverHIS641_0607970 [Cutaneotrichosporon cavernicola]